MLNLRVKKRECTTVNFLKFFKKTSWICLQSQVIVCWRQSSLVRKALTAKNSSWFSQVSVDSSTQSEKHVFNRQKYSYVYYQYWTFLLRCTGCCPTDFAFILPANSHLRDSTCAQSSSQAGYWIEHKGVCASWGWAEHTSWTLKNSSDVQQAHRHLSELCEGVCGSWLGE